MIRDMDLIRLLLRKVEENSALNGRTTWSDYTPEDLDITEYSIDEIRYHLDLLIKSGYLDGDIDSGYELPNIRSLTMAGHDFTDGTRTENTWKKKSSMLLSIGEEKSR